MVGPKESLLSATTVMPVYVFLVGDVVIALIFLLHLYHRGKP
jgi:hypothetical protein